MKLMLSRRFPRHIRQSIGFFLTLTGILAALASIYFIYDKFSITLAHKPGFLTPNSRLIAIMPVSSYELDEPLNAWSRQVTQSLSDELSGHMALRMIDKRSVSQALKSHLDRAAIFQVFQIDYLLTGGVMRLDDQVVLNLHLYDSADGEPVWTQSYAGRWKDNKSFLVDVTKTTFSQLSERIFPQIKRLVEQGVARVRKPPDPEALHVYYQAIELLGTNNGQSKMLATLLLHQVIKLQSDFAPAHTLLAQLAFRQAEDSASSSIETFEQINQKLDLAHALDRTKGLPYGLKAELAYKYKRNMPLAEVYFQQAIALSPSDFDIRFAYAEFLLAMGETYDGLVQLEVGKRLNPMAYSKLEVVKFYTMAGDYVNAEKELDKITPAKPSSPDYYITAQYLYQCNGDELQAFASYLSIFQMLGFAKADIARVMALYEERGLAGVNYWLALEKQEQLDIGQFLPPLATAYYLAGANRNDEALEYLTLAAKQNQLGLLFAKNDPRFSAIKDRPAFIDAMKKAGFIYFEQY